MRRCLPYDALDAQVTHQTLHCAPRHGCSLAVKLPPHLPSAVNPEVLLPHPPDQRPQFGIAAGTLRTPLRLALPSFVFVIGGRGDRQLLTNRLDPKRLSVFVHERGQLLGRRSSSA